MIYSYSLKNYYSIDEPVNVSFLVGEQAPKTTGYVDSGAGDRLSLVEAIVGPNASGKTNVIKGLAFLRYLIAYSYSSDPDSEIPLTSFMTKDSPSELSTVFSIKDRIFSYDFILSRERIIKEVLKEQSFSTSRKTFKTLFSREWSRADGAYSVINNLPNFSLNTKNNLRKNASVVSLANLESDDPSSVVGMIVQYWRQSVVTNVFEKGHWGDGDLNHTPTTHSHIEYFFKNPHLKLQLKKLLASYDLGFSDLIKDESGLQKEATYGIEHTYLNKSFSLPLYYESSGTIRMLTILKVALTALSKEGGVAGIDELDAYLHPDIVEAVVRLFSSSEVNKNRSQLIFSTHNHRMLNEFDKQQIMLVEKTEKGCTDLWRLDDVKGVRSDDNYYTKYISGSYGAIPRIDN